MKNTKFQREVNIFSKEAILKRFQANETNFSVLKGKIEALISESEIIELQNSKVTMYSKLAVVKYGLWIYAGTNQEFTDGSDQFRLYNLTAVTGKTLGIASDRHVGTIASSSKRYKDSMGRFPQRMPVKCCVFQ